MKTEQEKNKSKQKQNKKLITFGSIGVAAILAIVLVTRLNGKEEVKNPIDLNEPRQESDLGQQDASKDLALGNEPEIEKNIDFSQITKEVEKPKPTEEVNKEEKNTETENRSQSQHTANSDVNSSGNASIRPPAVSGNTTDSNSIKPNSQGTKANQIPDSLQAGSTQVVSKAEKTSGSSSAKIDKGEPQSELADETLNAEVKNLKFDAAAGLAWPMKGDILMGFSIDHGIYHATLAQFRTNPAVLIKAEAGDEVLSAAKGIVTKVEEDAKLGVTVTVALGDEYQLTYGQLKEATRKAGDTIEEGDVIGTLATVSRFYRMEGDHLYFQVMQGDKSVDPMLFLRSEE